jgi:hypothetical protein
MMRKVTVEEATVGDIVAAPIINEQGRVLLPVGAKLSAAVLSRLKGWGVNELTIEGEDPDNPAKSKEDILTELDQRFADWEGDALMMQIKEIAHGHLQRI